VAASLALLCAGTTATASAAESADALHVRPPIVDGINVDTATIPDLQKAMSQGRLSSEELTRFYLRRISQLNPTLHAVISITSDALAQARASDERRRHHATLGPMDGIPLLLKDNIDTTDAPTTAGSLALVGDRPAQNAGLVQRLRSAGAIILGKANMSEWAGYRGFSGVTGWSGVGGLTENPYVLEDSACGSSSGPAAAVAADLATVAVGTETDGSVVCPSGTNGLVGIKPSLGLVSRGGVIPITREQDTAGPIARNVTDAAILLAAMDGPDPRDPITTTDQAEDHALDNYTKFLKPGALKGKRIGVWRDQGWIGESPDTDVVFNQAVAQLQKLGATTVDVQIPYLDTVGNDEFPAIHYEFKHDINAYLASTPGVHPADLAGLIQFDNDNAGTEMQFFGQQIWLSAQASDGDLNDPTHVQLRTDAKTAAQQGIDQTLAKYHLDAIVGPTNNPAWHNVLFPGTDGDAGNLLGTSTPAAVSGYTAMTVPAGFVGPRPVGLTIMAGQYSEPTVIGLAYAFEQATHDRQPPTFLPTAP
jgi:amidase